MELFNNLTPTEVANLLYEAIRDEGQRIVSAGIATPAEVLSFVNPQIKQSFTTEDEISADFLKILSAVHRKLSAIKLPGDFKPAKPVEVEAKAKDDCACHVKTESASTDDTSFIKVAVDKLIAALEVLARSAGSRGDYTGALMIERRLAELKRLSESGDLVVSAGFMAEIELINDFKDKFPNKNISAELRLQAQNFKQDPVTAAVELRKQWNS